MTYAWPIARIWAYRELAFEMIKRELLSLHKGSILGYTWLLISPLIQTIAYLAITSGVMQQQAVINFETISWLLVGMGTWQIFSKTLSDAPSLILGRIDIIKQVYFPLELLPLPRLFLSIVSGSFLYIVAILILGFTQTFTLKIMCLPVVMLVGAVFLIPLSWLLAVVGVLMRDLRELIGILLNFLIFISPAIFPPDGPAHPTLRFLMEYNPLTPFIQITLWCFGAPVSEMAWLKAVCLAIVSLLIGSKVLQVAKNKISEMI